MNYINLLKDHRTAGRTNIESFEFDVYFDSSKNNVFLNNLRPYMMQLLHNDIKFMIHIACRLSTNSTVHFSENKTDKNRS